MPEAKKRAATAPKESKPKKQPPADAMAPAYRAQLPQYPSWWWWP